MSGKILVIRNSALGDVAMTLPVLYSAAMQYPDTEFYLLTRPFFAKIFVNKPDNLKIIEADYKGRHRGFGELCRLAKDLSAYGFTAVADLHNVLRSWIIDASMYVRGTKVAMVDKRRKDRISIAARSDQQSFISRYADVFARLGYPISLSFRSIFQEGTSQEPLEIRHPAVGIAPFARYQNKTYPIEMMEQVVARLSADGINVYLYGAKGTEAQTLAGWASKYPHCTSLAAKMDITSELAAMSQMDVMVTMDSANQHLASIVGTPVISIWGSTVPGCGFYGYGQNPDNAVYLGIDCQPCTVAGSKKCPKGTLDCLRGISPDDLYRKVKAAISHDEVQKATPMDHPTAHTH